MGRKRIFFPWIFFARFTENSSSFFASLSLLAVDFLAPGPHAFRFRFLFHFGADEIARPTT